MLLYFICGLIFDKLNHVLNSCETRVHQGSVLLLTRLIPIIDRTPSRDIIDLTKPNNGSSNSKSGLSLSPVKNANMIGCIGLRTLLTSWGKE